MSKPLELVVYDLNSNHHLRAKSHPRSATARAKRLTDAELAAEYHSWDSICRREQWIEAVRGDDYTDRERRGQDQLYERLNTLYRFATHPHYDEETR